MAKKITKENIRIEVCPKVYAKILTTAEQEIRDCEAIIEQINRHVDDIAYCEVIWDTEITCEYCNYTWDETESCCARAQEEFLLLGERSV